jgi:hypothetical protein
MNLRRMGRNSVDWIEFVQDRNQWRALMDTNESSGSMKCWKVLELLHNWQLLEKGSASWS